MAIDHDKVVNRILVTAGVLYIAALIALAVISVGELFRPVPAVTKRGYSWSQMMDSEVTVTFPVMNGVVGSHTIGAGIEGTWRGRPVILTVAHCVPEDNTTVKIRHYTYSGLPDTNRETVVWKVDRKADIALLLPKTNRPGADLVPLSDMQYSCPYRGQESIAIGSPNAIEFMVTRGVISNPFLSTGGRIYPLNRDVIAVTDQSWRGSSGGPIFVQQNGRYQLVGLVSNSLGPCHERCSMAGVPTKNLLEFLEDCFAK